MYLQLLDRDLNIEDFRKELFHFDKWQVAQRENERQQIDEKRKKLTLERAQMEKQRRDMLIANKDVGAFTKSGQKDAVKPVEEVFPYPENDPSLTIFKVAFRRAIEFKTWTSDQAPNVVLFERIILKIKKICMNHPTELLQSNETGATTWMRILGSLFKLAQNEKLHRKRYCRGYLVRKLIDFVKATLPEGNLKQMIDSVLKMQDKIKWRAVRELIVEVFQDLQAEQGMCESGTSLVQEECKYMEEGMFFEKGNGLVFKYLRCELCKRDVDKTSKDSNFTAFVSGYKQEDDVLLLFECTRNPWFNHVYHQGCLKQFVLEEYRKNDKKGVGPGLKESEVIKNFRCPECYQQKQIIDEEKQKMSMMRASKTRPESRAGPGRKNEK